MDRRQNTRGAVRACEMKPGCFIASNDRASLGFVRTSGRIQGYLIHAMQRGADHIIWDKHRFAKRTQLKVEYIEEAMRRFRKTTTVFRIYEIRLGRSTRLCVEYRSGGQGCSLERVQGRLMKYILGAVKKRGYARVNARFLEFFCDTTQLPKELVRLAWQRLKAVPGCRSGWRGEGDAIEFYVARTFCHASLQGSVPAYGFPSGRRDNKYKTTSPAAPDGPNRTTAASPPPAGAGAPTTGARRGHPSAKCSTRPQRTPEHPNPRQALNGLAGSAAHAEFSGPGPAIDYRRSPLAEPFPAGGRWISGRSLEPLARWLAVEPMRAVHDRPGLKVCWMFAHARNFAWRALRFGHQVEAIVAAYQAGVLRSHDDASDAGETLHDHEPRKPSAAVNYAWRELGKDRRSRDERWADFFAGARVSRRPRVKVGSGVEDKTAVAKKSSTGGRDREKFAQVKAGLEVPTAVVRKFGAAQLLAYLQPRGLTLADFNQLTFSAKKRLLQAAIAQHDAQAPENK